ncbi:MAG: hypothetical protein IPK53_03345 [bacterium]|nr:hypothetical protein [bacterium]
MDSNYEWQKHQAKERAQSRLEEAEAHRLAKQVSTPSSFPLLLKVMLPIVAGVIVAIWLLTSCAPIADTSIETAGAANHTQVTLAERIRFQDARDSYLAGTSAVTVGMPAPLWTMGDRIRFQDRFDEHRP